MTEPTVRRWISEGYISAELNGGRYEIPYQENSSFIIQRWRELSEQRYDSPWVPDDLTKYDAWHTVLDELVWLMKVTYSSREELRRRKFRLDHMFQTHIRRNVSSLAALKPALNTNSRASQNAIEEDLRRAWYNELAFVFPIRTSTLGLSFGDIDANIQDSERRLTFPSWRFIQAYYAIYFYVRCLCLIKTKSIRLEQHFGPINIFKNGVLDACDQTIWPWPLNIRHIPNRRVERSSLPISKIEYLKYKYARHPRVPNRTPIESYNYIRAELRKRASKGYKARRYTLIDFLYEFRIWANYQDIDSLLALWGAGYRTFVDMNLSAIMFFVAGSVELAFSATFGPKAYTNQLQDFYDGFIARDHILSADFRNTPLFQRLEIFRGESLVESSVRIEASPNPHEVDLLEPNRQN